MPRLRPFAPAPGRFAAPDRPGAPGAGPGDTFARALLGLSLTLVSLDAVAAKPGASGVTWWATAEVGASRIERTGGVEADDSTLHLALAGGVAVTRQLRLGLEAGGETIEASNLQDPAQGEGLSTIYLVAEYHWDPEPTGWYAKAGAGTVEFRDNDAFDREGSGRGTLVAVGYDWDAGRLGLLGPFLALSRGDADGIEYRVASVGLRWGWRK